jgi:mannose-1-phosphate guanylyltransferase
MMILPVVLSGGAGTRLWPVSREGYPKPFMKLADGESLLQKSYLRAAAIDHVSDILTITNRDYYFKSKDEFQSVQPGTGTTSSSFLLEPRGRNTAPAIALGTLYAADLYGPDTVLLVLPADHLIRDQAAFARNVQQAVPLAASGKLVTFGIKPAAPETGFGYIECGAPCENGGRIVVRFAEKPSPENARAYLEAGNYLWNSGMFCFSASTMLSQMERYAPDLYGKALACWRESRDAAGDELRIAEIDADTFAALPDISIDYAVMEKTSDAVVIPAEFDWSDIGSWNAISELTPPDEAGNRVVGEAVLVNTTDCYIQSEDRLVATVGLEKLVIVDTPDALLVARRDQTQDVKQVVRQLKQMAHESYRLHRTVSRPWGTYTVLEEGSRFKIKRIEVKPGASLSLQMHHHRSEHWVVVSGMAKVVNGEQAYLINTNESTYIPAGHQHRLENPGVIDLVMIEVQSGEYLGEDDIVRYQDIYGRS